MEGAPMSVVDRPRPALPLAPATAVFAYYITAHRRTWRSSVFSSFLLPLLTVLSFGVGVGAYVDQQVGGVSYLHWIMPGLLASTALQVGIAESSWTVLGNFEWIKTYLAQAASPLRTADILGGHLAFVLYRVLISCAAFLLVAAFFGALHSPWALATLPLVLLIGLAVAAPTFAYSSSVHSDSYLILLFRFGVIPMTLFAGVFFPVETLPWGLRWLAYASPLWHGVDLCRAATLGVAPDWSLAGHVLYLTAWVVGGWFLAHHRFRRRLVI